MTSLVPLEIGTEGNISGAHNVPREWRAMVHKNVEHHKRIEISKNRRKKRHCTGDCLFANDAKKGSLASYMNTLPHHQTQKCTLDFVWINVLSCSSIAKQQQQQQQQQHVTSGIVARNVLSSTKCVGGSRDKRSLIKTFATWILPCAEGLFQHLYTESSFETIFPTAGYATLPELPKRVFLWLHVDAWFVLPLLPPQTSFRGPFTAESLDNGPQLDNGPVKSEVVIDS